MRRLLPIFTVALLAFAPGCFNQDDTSTGDTVFGSDKPENSKNTILRIQLTDAPYPYSSVSSADITVESVEVRMDGGFHMLPVAAAPVSMNLLDLQNGMTEVLVDTAISPGTIDQIRLVISSASVTLTDGRTFDLQVPSGESSGLKVFLSPGVQVASGLSTDLLLDFDVSQSFKPIPASAVRTEDIRGFMLHPVLRVANLSQTGSVSGNVWNDHGTPDTSDDTLIEGATVSAWSSNMQLSGTASNEQGFFKMAGLTPGTVTLFAEAPGFNSVNLDVTVVVGNESAGNDIRLTPSQRDRNRTSQQL
jgi:hypothetical protein